jgi:hypothetical protein
MDGIAKFVLLPEKHRSPAHAAKWLDKHIPNNLDKSGTMGPTWATDTPDKF